MLIKNTAIALIAAPAALYAQSTNIDSVAPQLLEQYGEALVGIEGVLEINAQVMGQSNQEEQAVSANAIVINEQGYMIASLSSLDPSEAMNGRTVNTPAGPQVVTIDAKLTDLRIVFQDGTEFSARAALRDGQNDLILLVPNDEDAASHEWKFIPLHTEVENPSILEKVLLVGRHDADLDRALNAQTTEVESVIERPRTFFVPANGSPGQVAFNAAGHAIGITVQKLKDGTALEGNLIIQPTSEILRLVEQAGDNAEQPVVEAEEESTEEVAASATSEA